MIWPQTWSVVAHLVVVDVDMVELVLLGAAVLARGVDAVFPADHLKQP